MSLETFAERVRFGGIDHFVLWQSAFDFDVPDRVLLDESRRIPVFATAEAARAYAAERGVKLGTLKEGVDITHDLDAVAAWASLPDVAALDHGVVVKAWMFLESAGVLPGMYDDDIGEPLQGVVSQLDRAEVAKYDAESAHLTPEWTAEELTLLAGTLQRGVEEFASKLSSVDAV